MDGMASEGCDAGGVQHQMVQHGQNGDAPLPFGGMRDLDRF